MKIIVFIPFYNPDFETFKNNLFTIVDSVDYIIIYKNSPSNEEFDILLKKFKNKIIILGNQFNIGIARSFNYSIMFLNKNNINYDYILYLDQDSVFVDFNNFLISISKSIKGNFIYTPIINKEVKNDVYSDEIDFFIMSGTFFPKEIFDNVGNFNELLSVDCVDYDYSLRSRNHGYSIIRLNQYRLIQNFGETIIYKYLGLYFYNNIYSTHRLYFISRNFVYFIKSNLKILNYSFIFKIVYHYYFRRIFFVLFFEKQKFNKILSIFSGFFHGLSNNFNKNY